MNLHFRAKERDESFLLIAAFPIVIYRSMISAFDFQ